MESRGKTTRRRDAPRVARGFGDAASTNQTVAASFGGGRSRRRDARRAWGTRRPGRWRRRRRGVDAPSASDKSASTRQNTGARCRTKRSKDDVGCFPLGVSDFSASPVASPGRFVSDDGVGSAVAAARSRDGGEDGDPRDDVQTRQTTGVGEHPGRRARVHSSQPVSATNAGGSFRNSSSSVAEYVAPEEEGTPCFGGASSGDVSCSGRDVSCSGGNGSRFLAIPSSDARFLGGSDSSSDGPPISAVMTRTDPSASRQYFLLARANASDRMASWLVASGRSTVPSRSSPEIQDTNARVLERTRDGNRRSGRRGNRRSGGQGERGQLAKRAPSSRVSRRRRRRFRETRRRRGRGRRRGHVDVDDVFVDDVFVDVDEHIVASHIVASHIVASRIVASHIVASHIVASHIVASPSRGHLGVRDAVDDGEPLDATVVGFDLVAVEASFAAAAPSTPREATTQRRPRDLSGHLKRLPENSTRGLDRCRVRARRVGARRGRAPSRPARASPTSTSTRMKASRPTRMKAPRLPSPLDHRPRFRLRDPRRVVGDTADRSRSGRARYTFSDTSDNENRRRPIRRAREIRRNPRRRATPPPRDTARDTRRAPRGRTRERARPRRPEAARVDRARTREQSGRIRRRSSRRRPRRGEDTRLRGTRRRLARARDLAPRIRGRTSSLARRQGSAALAARQRARWFDAPSPPNTAGPSAGSSSAPPRHRQHVPIESISRPFRATSGPSSKDVSIASAASAASVASIASAASIASVASTNSSESSESSVSSVSSFARRNARCRAAICSITARCRAHKTFSRRSAAAASASASIADDGEPDASGERSEPAPTFSSAIRVVDDGAKMPLARSDAASDDAHSATRIVACDAPSLHSHPRARRDASARVRTVKSPTGHGPMSRRRRTLG